MFQRFAARKTKLKLLVAAVAVVATASGSLAVATSANATIAYRSCQSMGVNVQAYKKPYNGYSGIYSYWVTPYFPKAWTMTEAIRTSSGTLATGTQTSHTGAAGAWAYLWRNSGSRPYVKFMGSYAGTSCVSYVYL